ncbi:hypothetical protein IIA79_01875 [bacterium]|nr:hypothetical protein [bacterium]
MAKQIGILVAAAALLLALFGCDLAKDTGGKAKEGEEKAVGIAEKMSDGTLKGADLDSDDFMAEDEDEDENEGDGWSE